MRNSRDFRPTLVVITLIIAIIAFEVFNYDTTRFALSNLLGSAAFVRVRWATILAIAFGGIDFAGLFQIFGTDATEVDTAQKYLFAAWLVGATLNAMMTWYAVGITLLDHPIGNEIVTREQLIRWVPPFVAALVWITRILFIGALTLMGDIVQSVLKPPRRLRSAPPNPPPITRARIREMPARPNLNGQTEEVELHFSHREGIEC